MRSVFNENAPSGHYSPGVISGTTLYVSGQTSADPATGQPAAGGFEAEMNMALKKLESVLSAAGCARSDVIMCRVYVTSIDYWLKANELFRQFFGEHRPARAIVPVGTLNKGCLVEIEAVAELR